MYIEVHDHMGAARRIPCTRVVIYDELGNPISLALEYQQGTIMAATADHVDFNGMLHNLGINKTVVVRQPNQTLLRK